MEKPKESSSNIPAEKNSILIAEVKKFPSLYDTSDPNYYVLAERNKAWLQVADNCDEPADLCHLRWKSLRKRYAKEKRRFNEILQGRRRPWALFPKMSFLTPTTSKRRVRPVKTKRKSESRTNIIEGFKQNASDDDMLIVDDNDEIVRTCKSVEMSEEDEYIYETLDDPDSALEIMKDRPQPKVKPTAIRSGGSTNSVPSVARPSASGRIRKLTPKMQNSIIAKKLKQAQQILQQSNGSNSGLNQKPSALQKVMIANNKTPVVNKPVLDKAVLYQDTTTRHVATVNPNIIRIERLTGKEDSQHPSTHNSPKVTDKKQPETTTSEGNRPFKVIKLKGRNPIIFSPEQLPNIQSFLKSEGSCHQEQSDRRTPLIKVKSVDNLNNQNTSSSNNESSEIGNNMDIIHSVGLVRRNTTEKSTANIQSQSFAKPIEKSDCQSYSRAYSWNKPSAKVANKQTATEKIPQPDSQTNDYEIEETWNDIKQENIDDDAIWPHSYHLLEEARRQQHEEMINQPESPNKTNIWNKLNEAKLELVAYQRRLLEEQHKKNLEYMKKEHDLKMTLLRAEIDLKRKQLNIML